MVLTDQLHAFWKFNNSRLDSVGGLEMVSADAGDHFLPGKIGQGWNGNDDADRALAVNPSTINPFEAPFSYSFWVRITAANPARAVFLVRSGTTSTKIRVTVGTSTDGLFVQFGIGISGGPIVPYNENVVFDAWNHLAFTYDWSAGSPYPCKCFINGVKTETTTTSVVTAIATPTTHVGQPGLQAPDMDALGFWDRVLTDAEVAELYGGGSGLELPPAVLSSIKANKKGLSLGLSVGF